MPHTLKRSGLALLALCMLTVQAVQAQDLLDEFEKKVTTFTLDNGLRFIVVERHEAPVASFFTYADVGSVDEVKGITGLAHIFEHMAFKGTNTVGTKDIEAELSALAALDAAYERLRRERQKGDLTDPAALASLEEAFAAAQEAAQGFVESNEFDEIVQRAGGVGMNATTSVDATRYFYSLPANKMELWFSLESDRFLNPVLREFYKERDVVMEERRMRTESNPFGRLFEEFTTTAFKAHPYGEPTVGHMADLQTVTRAEALDFFRTYYGPQNLVMAVAGDVDPAEVKRLAETYFGRIPAGTKPEPVETVEPPQIGERRVIIREQSQPVLMMGWHKPSIHHPDEPAFDVFSTILSGGRTSRLYKELVEEQQLALNVGGFGGYPGVKYPNLFVIYGLPNRGHTPDEVEAAILEIIERIKTEGVTQEELERAKTNARAGLIRQLGSNTGLAGQVTFYEAVTGDWRNLFRGLDAIQAVTAEDVQRIVRETFTPNNRTVAMIKTEDDGATASN